VAYETADIRTSLPAGPFDNVIWDAAIEHFSEEEIRGLVAGIRERLRPDGVLSGYTVLEEAGKQHPDHEYEFRTKADLARFLTPHFANVLVFETAYPTRRNLYFFASDAALPFDPSWPDSLRIPAEG
jgi:SAM-dependent methyltransferase